MSRSKPRSLWPASSEYRLGPRVYLLSRFQIIAKWPRSRTALGLPPFESEKQALRRPFAARLEALDPSAPCARLALSWSERNEDPTQLGLTLPRALDAASSI